MKGSNTLELNEATVIEALQFYFDNVLFADGAAPKVTAIEMTKGGVGYSSVDVFRVSVTEPTPPALVVTESPPKP